MATIAVMNCVNETPSVSENALTRLNCGREIYDLTRWLEAVLLILV